MKFSIVATSFLIVLLFSSCSKDDDDNNTGGVGEGTMIAKIDSTTYSNSNHSGQAIITSLSTTYKLVIKSSNSDGRSIEMVVYGYSGPGIYPIQYTGNHPHRGYYQETDIENPTSFELWQAPCESCPEGMVEIAEETSTAIKGEFNFVVYNEFAATNEAKTLHITEGIFNLPKH